MKKLRATLGSILIAMSSLALYQGIQDYQIKINRKLGLVSKESLIMVTFMGICGLLILISKNIPQDKFSMIRRGISFLFTITASTALFLSVNMTTVGIIALIIASALFLIVIDDLILLINKNTGFIALTINEQKMKITQQSPLNITIWEYNYNSATEGADFISSCSLWAKEFESFNFDISVTFHGNIVTKENNFEILKTEATKFFKVVIKNKQLTNAFLLNIIDATYKEYKNEFSKRDKAKQYYNLYPNPIPKEILIDLIHDFCETFYFQQIENK